MYNSKNGGGEEFIKAAYRKETINIEDARESSNHSDRFRPDQSKPTVFWNPGKGLITTNGGLQSPATGLEHELDHANAFVSDMTNGTTYHHDRQVSPDESYTNAEECRVITGSETKTALANGEATRNNHRGDEYYTTSPTSTEPRN